MLYQRRSAEQLNRPGPIVAFNSAIFIVFFLLFYPLHAVVQTLPGRPHLRIGLILVASIVFYAAWDYRFVPLLFASISIDFFIARAIGQSRTTSRRRALLVASVAMNLGLLAFFKYANFFVDNARATAEAVGFEGLAVSNLDIILPVGISFYTFQSLSYTIDVYRGSIKPTNHFGAFAASVSFFPQLVAGPIVRAGHLLPQMLQGPRLEFSRAQLGVLLVALGAFKKTVADLLAPIVDTAFSAPPDGLLQAWVGALAFAGQIYGDFSGYTDIAIGLAFMMGYNFPGNFRLPYLATSPSDFWRRWHISLSTWLRDYLYIPLGGNRHHLYRNLLLTMVLGGLWHGAQWTFVAWGLYHGLLLAGQRGLGIASNESPTGPRRWLQIAAMFYLTTLGWVLFRASSLDDAWTMILTMHGGNLTVDEPLGRLASLVALAIVGPHFLDAVILRYQTRLSPVVVWVFTFIALVFSLVMGGSNYAFIYFQF